jgi:hypothetical protein
MTCSGFTSAEDAADLKNGTRTCREKSLHAGFGRRLKKPMLTALLHSHRLKPRVYDNVAREARSFDFQIASLVKKLPHRMQHGSTDAENFHRA